MPRAKGQPRGYDAIPSGVERAPTYGDSNYGLGRGRYKNVEEIEGGISHNTEEDVQEVVGKGTGEILSWQNEKAQEEFKKGEWKKSSKVPPLRRPDVTESPLVVGGTSISESGAKDELRHGSSKMETEFYNRGTFRGDKHGKRSSRPTPNPEGYRFRQDGSRGSDRSDVTEIERPAKDSEVLRKAA